MSKPTNDRVKVNPILCFFSWQKRSKRDWRQVTEVSKQREGTSEGSKRMMDGWKSEADRQNTLVATHRNIKKQHTQPPTTFENSKTLKSNWKIT